MERRQQELVRQFRDGALAVASALGCGYSIENAFSQAAESMSAVYGEDGYITLEFEWICSRLALNQTVEEEIRSLAVRSGQEDIRQFAEVFGAAKRSSGDLSAILRDTAELLGKKIQLREEIRTMIAAKRLEQNMMCLMPAAVLIYIELTNPGYTDVLYQGMAGHLIMTVCLGVYVLAIWWGRKILDIEI
ncbi:MAG: type II secretion system F family protein [Clostridiales bacterium]|nr:type II secretion system F family protein [Clostridiales bacterium]